MANYKEIRDHVEGRRTFSTQASVSAVETRSDDATLRLSGEAAVFDSDSELLFGMFVEQIKRGAFRKVLSKNPDVRFMENHDGASYGRTKNNTLRLWETATGLNYEVELNPEDQDARNLYARVKRGDMDQMSFAFTVAGDSWEKLCECTPTQRCECTERRYINEIGELYEVSVVTFPAYASTSAEVSRSAEPESQESCGGSEQQPDNSGESGDRSTQLSANGTNHALRARIQTIRTRRYSNESGTQGSPREGNRAA